MRTLEWNIDLPVDPATLWEFHIDPRNAAKIAPPRPPVEIVDARPFTGLGDAFTFRIRFGPLSIIWEGRIIEWDPPRAFTDEQVRGPFQVFRHTHRIGPAPDGARLTDRVTYAMRGGPLGPVIDAIQGRRALEAMFAHRHRALRALFGSGENTSSPKE